MSFIKFFGYLMATGVVATSLLMAILGGKFQRIEAGAYAGERRPWWFKIIAATIIIIYLAAVYDFWHSPKTWASWVLVVIIPIGWAVKAAMVVFNSAGRQTVSSISGNQAWYKVALYRLPAAVLMGALAWFA